jgi:hypothetical protein
MGPALVPADDIAEAQVFQVRLWDNDEPDQDFPASTIAQDVPDIVLRR